eukprot:gene15454-18335_t
MTETTKEEIASFLLSKGYYLTALEYYQELLEDDGTELESLRTHFITNMPTTNQQDPIRVLKVAVAGGQRDDLDGVSKDKIKPHERKILNHLLKAYLQAHGYKYTVVSFSEENTDDVRTWSELGVQGPEPPSLLTIYRYFFENGDSGFQGVLSKTMSEISKLKKEREEHDGQWRDAKARLQRERDDLQTKIKEYEATIEMLKSRTTLTASMGMPMMPSTSTTTTDNTITSPVKSSRSSMRGSSVNESALSVMRRTYRSLVTRRRQTVAFRIAVNDDDSEASARIAEEVERLRAVDSSDNVAKLVRVLANALPHILSGVLLVKREELIPVILVVIMNHTDETTRFAMTKMLFNLIKRPNEIQRHAIMKGCMALASIVGPSRTETEILSQCWEQLSEKHPERRVLVADSCGCLAQFASPELRISLVLSILQQLGTDKSSLVRVAVAKNFSLLINFFETDDKYNQVEESFKALLYDAEAEEEFKMPEVDVLKIEKLLKCFTSITPRIHQSILSSSPFEKDARNIEAEYDRQEALYQYQLNKPTEGGAEHANSNNASGSSTRTSNGKSSSEEVSILGTQEVSKLHAQFDQYLLSIVTNEVPSTSEWSSLAWVANDFITRFINILYCIPIANVSLIALFSKAFNVFCTEFGAIFTKRIIKNAFQKEFQKDNRATGVLVSLEPTELSGFLSDIVVQIAMEDRGWEHSSLPALVRCIELLCGNVFDRKKDVGDTLCNLATNPSNQVRSCILNLFKVIIPLFTPQQISSSIVPKLISLSTDPDRDVRFVCIGALTIALSQISDDSTLEKIAIAIEKILDDKNHRIEGEFVKSMTKIIPTVKQRFRDSFILPKIAEYARRNNNNPSPDHRKEMSQILFDAVRAFISVTLSKDLLQEQIHPTLKLLLNDAYLHDASFKSMVLSSIELLENGIKDDLRANLARKKPAASSSVGS